MNIGIDLGGSHIGVALVKEDKIIIKKEKEFSEEEKEQIEDVLKKIIPQYIEEILEEMPEAKIESVGVGSPGFFENGCITKTTNLKIKCLPIKKLIQDKINVPVFMENDGRCAAIAEKIHGNLSQVKNGVFLTLGTGIGGAVFIDDKIVPRLRKIGHMIVQKDGRKCNCGKAGCLETYASMKALKTQIRKRLGNENLSSREILSFLEQEENKNQVEDILEEYISYLAIGVSNVINLFSPEKLVIGGSFVHFEKILMPLLLQEIKESKLNVRSEDVKIETAKFNNDAGIIGAANLENFS